MELRDIYYINKKKWEVYITESNQVIILSPNSSNKIINMIKKVLHSQYIHHNISNINGKRTFKIRCNERMSKRVIKILEENEDR